MNTGGEVEEGDGPSEKSVEKREDKVAEGLLLADTPTTLNWYLDICVS